MGRAQLRAHTQASRREAKLCPVPASCLPSRTVDLSPPLGGRRFHCVHKYCLVARRAYGGVGTVGLVPVNEYNLGRRTGGTCTARALRLRRARKFRMHNALFAVQNDTIFEDMSASGRLNMYWADENMLEGPETKWEYFRVSRFLRTRDGDSERQRRHTLPVRSCLVAWVSLVQ